MATAADLGPLLGGQRIVAFSQGIAASTVGDVQHRAGVEVAHDGDELTPLKRLLIDAERDHRLGRPTSQTAIHRPLHDAVGLGPRQVELPGRRRPAGLGHPVDGQPFEQGREVTVRLGPRHANLPHAVLGTRRPRHVGLQDRLKLTGVEMSPPTWLSVIARAGLTAFGTRESRTVTPAQLHEHRTGRSVSSSTSATTHGSGNPRISRIQVSIPHGTPPRRVPLGYQTGPPTHKEVGRAPIVTNLTNRLRPRPLN